MGQPLEGLLAIDLSRVLAGPTVTRLMAELGARVVKVESPAGGDSSRSLPFLRDGRSGYFIQQNRGKESLAVDLRTPDGMAALDDLLGHADVLVENFRPGVLDSMGLGWKTLHERHPQLVLCSVTALGYDGPLSEKGGYDTIGAALSGIAHVSGPVGGPPMMPTAAIGDTMTGVHGFGGVMAALFNRSRTGRGDWVQVSLLDSYIACHEINIQAFAGSDGAVVPGPTGSTHPTVVPCGIFTVRGVHVFIACVNPIDWSRLAAAMDRPELGEHPDFRTNADRVVLKETIFAMIDDWLSGFADVDDAIAVLDRHGVACCRILSVPEAIAHPHNIARRAVRTVADDRWGSITLPGMPIRLVSATEPELRAEELGESSVDVLREINGYDDERIAALVASGAVTVAPQRTPSPTPDTSSKETS